MYCSYGYDPLGLGKDPAALAKYQQSEVLNARWAMLAAAGIIIPEGLQVLVQVAALPVAYNSDYCKHLDCWCMLKSLELDFLLCQHSKLQSLSSSPSVPHTEILLSCILIRPHISWPLYGFFTPFTCVTCCCRPMAQPSRVEPGSRLAQRCLTAAL